MTDRWLAIPRVMKCLVILKLLKLYNEGMVHSILLSQKMGGGMVPMVLLLLGLGRSSKGLTESRRLPRRIKCPTPWTPCLCQHKLWTPPEGRSQLSPLRQGRLPSCCRLWEGFKEGLDFFSLFYYITLWAKTKSWYNAKSLYNDAAEKEEGGFWYSKLFVMDWVDSQAEKGERGSPLKLQKKKESFVCDHLVFNIAFEYQ